MVEQIKTKPQVPPGPQATVELVSEPETPQKPATNRLKIILFSVLGLVVAASLVFAGYKLGQDQVVFGPKPTPMVAATPTPDPAASWETYTNTKVGFSFKYPQTLTISECKDGLHLFESISGLKASEFCETPPFGKISLDYAATPFNPGYSQSLDFETKEEQVSIGGVRATRQTVKKIQEAPGPDDAVFVIFSKESYHFLISLRERQYEPTFNLMLSTFKFLEEKAGGQKVFCTEPRPEVCTMECIVNPPYICGSDGKSYCSSCQACSNKNVEWYVTQQNPCKIQ